MKRLAIWTVSLYAIMVAREMLLLGFEKVYALKGGWREWLEAAYPTEPK